MAQNSCISVNLNGINREKGIAYTVDYRAKKRVITLNWRKWLYFSSARGRCVSDH